MSQQPPSTPAEALAQEAAKEAAAQAKAALAGAPKMAARLTDSHVCPQVIGIIPQPGIVITAPGESTVLIGYMPAAIEGGTCTCVGPPTSIKEGSGTVEIGGKAARRPLVCSTPRTTTDSSAPVTPP